MPPAGPAPTALPAGPLTRALPMNSPNSCFRPPRSTSFSAADGEGGGGGVQGMQSAGKERHISLHAKQLARRRLLPGQPTTT